MATLNQAVVVEDLRVLLGLSEALFDMARGTLVVSLAVNRAETVLTPVPDTAHAIVLGVAARAYTNPTGVESEVAGPFQRRFAVPTVELTAQEEEKLKALAAAAAGLRGAFTITPGPRPSAACPP